MHRHAGRHKHAASRWQPCIQELRSAIRSLHDDSKRKLTQDYEMQRALENLFGQVQAVREGLSTLSEAFIEESGKHHQRIVQVRRRAWLGGPGIVAQPTGPCTGVNGAAACRSRSA